MDRFETGQELQMYWFRRWIENGWGLRDLDTCLELCRLWERAYDAASEQLRDVFSRVGTIACCLLGMFMSVRALMSAVDPEFAQTSEYERWVSATNNFAEGWLYALGAIVRQGYVFHMDAAGWTFLMRCASGVAKGGGRLQVDPEDFAPSGSSLTLGALS